MMNYRNKIEIYKVKTDVFIPLMANPKQSANFSVGDYVLIIDGEVWIRDWSDTEEDQFAKASCPPSFIRGNKTIFDSVA